MRIVKPSFEIWEQEKELEGIHKQIERAGRICYASDPIEGKAKDFVDRMIRNGHTAMLEHGTVYLKIPHKNTYSIDAKPTVFGYEINKYSTVSNSREKLKYDTCNCWFITTNLRVLVENGWLDDLKYLCEPTPYHEKRVTVHFTTQIAITREFNRHRVNSMAEQSTRNCNYSNGKFDGVGINLPTWVESEIQRLDQISDYILPTFEQLKEEYFSVSEHGLTKDDWGDIEWWLWSNLIAEESYLKLIEKGRKPQEARVVLPLDTNTELVHTASIEEWKHFFTLRDDKQHAHPDAYVLAHPLHKEFKDKEFISVDTE